MGEVIPLRPRPATAPDAAGWAQRIRERNGWARPVPPAAAADDVCSCTTERDSVESCRMHGVRFGGRAVPAHVTSRRARAIREMGPLNPLGNAPREVAGD
jgi:hypothetical protein